MASIDPVRLPRASLSDEGATAVEYGILVALVALVIFAAVAGLGRSTLNLYDCAASAVEGLPDTPNC